MTKIRVTRFVVVFSLAIIAHRRSSYAQLDIDRTGRAGEPPKLREEESRPPPKAPPVILPPALVPKEKTAIPQLRAFIREIRIIGSAVLSLQI